MDGRWVSAQRRPANFEFGSRTYCHHIFLNICVNSSVSDARILIMVSEYDLMWILDLLSINHSLYAAKSRSQNLNLYICYCWIILSDALSSYWTSNIVSLSSESRFELAEFKTAHWCESEDAVCFHQRWEKKKRHFCLQYGRSSFCSQLTENTFQNWRHIIAVIYELSIKDEYCSKTSEPVQLLQFQNPCVCVWLQN